MPGELGHSGDSLYDSEREGFSPSEIPADWTPRDTPTPFFVRAADRLFRAVEESIMSGRIDSRSPIGDAALDYRDERQQMADHMRRGEATNRQAQAPLPASVSATPEGSQRGQSKC